MISNMHLYTQLPNYINLFLFHKDIEPLYSLANTELDSLDEWLLANKLSLSISQDKDTIYTLFAS